MENDCELFDLPCKEFVDRVFQRGGAWEWPAHMDLDSSMVRGILISLAYWVWLLAQHVRAPEEEE